MLFWKVVKNTIFMEQWIPFIDKSNIMTLVAKNQEFTVDGEWEHKFQVGDSISKNQGSLLVEYYRNGQLVEILNYADLRKEK
jgi:hypothetical protein